MFQDLRPASSTDVHAFMALYRRLCPDTRRRGAGDGVRSDAALVG
jgi:hypothetical protein